MEELTVGRDQLIDLWDHFFMQFGSLKYLPHAEMVPRHSEHGVSDQVRSSADVMSLDNLVYLSKAGISVLGPAAMLIYKPTTFSAQ